MDDARTLFAANLRQACSTRRSISQICREVGLNRQQFNRYTSGQSLPSPHNRLRIARLFGLEPEDFELPPEEFRRRLAPQQERQRPGDALLDGYPGDLHELRRHLGFYQTYHLSLSWPGRIVCSCAHLKEADGRVLVTSRERIVDARSGIKQHSRYVGLAAWWRSRIFVTERTHGEYPTIGQTILMPFEVHQRLYLHGVTMGVSWRNENAPYGARMIWRYLGQEVDRRALLKRCGVMPTETGRVPEPVWRYLTGPQARIVTI